VFPLVTVGLKYDAKVVYPCRASKTLVLLGQLENKEKQGVQRYLVKIQVNIFERSGNFSQLKAKAYTYIAVIYICFVSTNRA
jgi:hypothetical protein